MNDFGNSVTAVPRQSQRVTSQPSTRHGRSASSFAVIQEIKARKESKEILNYNNQVAPSSGVYSKSYNTRRSGFLFRPKL